MKRLRFARCAILFLWLLCLSSVQAQVPVSGQDTSGVPSALPADTTAQDSLPSTAPDSLRPPVRPIPFIGSLDPRLPARFITTDTLLPMLDYAHLGDLLHLVPGFFLRDLGSAGQWHGPTLNGVQGNSIAFLSDGVLLNEPYTGLFNINFYPLEHIERIEVVPGTRAFLYGFNATGGAVNLVSKSRKAIHPFSRLRYSESAYGFSIVDGMFSQDLIRGLNLSFGAQHTATGGRFPNNDYDAWNGRVKIRFNVSDRLNFFATEMYNQSQLGLSGGIADTTPSSLQFDRFRATMRSLDAYEKNTRNDVQLGAAFMPFADTTAITTLTLYYAKNLREYRDEENREEPNGIFLQQDHLARWYGAQFKQQVLLGSHLLNVTAETQQRRMSVSATTGRKSTTLLSLQGLYELRLFDRIQLATYGRLETYGAESHFSPGADAEFSPLSWLTLFGGFSRSYRNLTFQEIVSSDSIISSSLGASPPERHLLFEAGIRASINKETFAEVKFFTRQIDDAVGAERVFGSVDSSLFIYTRIPDLTYEGMTGAAGVRLWKFYAEGRAQYLRTIQDGRLVTPLPEFSGWTGVYFWGPLFKNHLNLKLGFRGRFFSAYRGLEFYSQPIAFVPSIQPEVAASTTGDFILLAHIGDATIHYIMENLWSSEYIVTPFYPLNDRVTRFGVSWDFLD